jgi:hypothetical protein
MLDRSIQTQRRPLSERGDDLYETPACAVEALLRVEKKIPHRIWEFCCGRNAIVNVLRAHGRDVFASDLVDYGDPTAHYRWDFLMERAPPPGYGECGLSNPPFKLAAQIVAHAIELDIPLIIVLLRATFLESGATGRTKQAAFRRFVLDEHPPARVHIFSRRLPMMHRAEWQGRKASSGMATGWFVWDRNHTGPTTVDRISWEPAPVLTNDDGLDIPGFLLREPAK